MAYRESFSEGRELFRTFWMGGFECSDKLNVSGARVDLLKETGHLRFLSEDYRRLKQIGIHTVREGIRWSQVEKQAYCYDWSTVRQMIHIAKKENMQVVWDLCHFGFPDDLSPLHPTFVRRFAAMCRDFVLEYRTIDPTEPLIITPINEISFLSWLGGEVGCTVPYCRRMGWDVKYRLAKAFIQGAREMKEIDDNLYIVSTEPLLNVVPPLAATREEIASACAAHDDQFQAMDMLLGISCPELGGDRDLVDVLGFNFYYHNQWQFDTREILGWANIPEDPRWRPLSALLQEAYERYQRPVMIAETSHPGEHRPQWIRYITEEVEKVVQWDIPFLGVCIYPVLDRPDWDRLHEWHESGLWQVDLTEGFRRVRCEPYAECLRKCMERVRPLIAPVLEMSDRKA